MVEQRGNELYHQLEVIQVVAEKARLGQPFKEEVDRTTIPSHFEELIVDPFDGTQDLHSHLQAFQVQNHSHFQRPGHTFHILVCYKQGHKVRGSILVQYQANEGVTIRVNNLDNKIFIKTFQKGLLIRQFNDYLALGKPASIEEIRAWIEKHMRPKRI
ncbi:hypothetical protein CR513_38000, partial [Mucuna pruriens]